LKASRFREAVGLGATTALLAAATCAMAIGNDDDEQRVGGGRERWELEQNWVSD